MRYGVLQRLLPKPVHRYILDFEARIEDAVTGFAAHVPAGSRVLDAGAGETRHATAFAGHRYFAHFVIVETMGCCCATVSRHLCLHRQTCCCSSQ